MADEMVWLANPQTGDAQQFPAGEAAELWQARGWEPTDAPQVPDPTDTYAVDGVERPDETKPAKAAAKKTTTKSARSGDEKE